MSERDKIVRWLRHLASRHAAIEVSANDVQPALHEHAMSTKIAYEMAADAIERGDHLTWKPEPAIPLSEWMKKPSVGR